MPNADLTRLGLMERKGFPESYDTNGLLRFLTDIKAGKRNVRAPLYSHLVYDVVPGEETEVDRPDILIVEGLNVLQPARMPKDGSVIPFVSDFFDFSVYIDADEADLHRWYVSRFLRLRHTAFRDPLSYFRRYAEIPEDEAIEVADGLWTPHQPRQPARKHRPDPPPRQPDPAQGRKPPHRGGGAATVVRRGSILRDASDLTARGSSG